MPPEVEDEVEVAAEEESTSEEEQGSAASSASDDDDAAVPTDETEEQEEEATPAISPKLQKLIDSRGGDQDKLVDSIYQTWNSVSAMRKELDELKQAAQTPKSTEPPPEVVEEVTQETDLPWVNEQITTTDAKIASVSKTQVTVLTQLDATRQEIAEIKGELKHADVDEKGALQARLDRLESKAETLADKWDSQNERLENLKLTKSQLTRDKTKAEREVSRKLVERQQQVAKFNAEKAEHLQDFVDSISAIGKEYGIEGKTLSYLADTIREKAVVHLTRLQARNPKSEGIDIESFVREKVQEYLEVQGDLAKKGFAKLSKDKLDATTKGAAKGTVASSKGNLTTSKEKWTPEFVRDRARRLLGN